ncbi:hypothetical protein [Spirulina sp. 06S082]|uniref:hypothetical protein n=1 Tax=Spirulina sp. 06S082 TaxID=3110248 RepID=UPI002B21AE81|nr:hypothetical protein [Spirulina sp. 06S082]MEA5472008.1 hypothetical protein [Spirulina sp. 06S082]
MNSTAIAVVEWGLNLIRAYLAAGFIFAIAFVLFLIPRVDPAVKSVIGSFKSGNSSHEENQSPSFLQRVNAIIVDLAIFFRILIIPGVTLFWPLFLLRLLRGKTHPKEQNAHRREAAKHAL